jgi:hypothetical protein
MKCAIKAPKPPRQALRMSKLQCALAGAPERKANDAGGRDVSPLQGEMRLKVAGYRGFAIVRPHAGGLLAGFREASGHARAGLQAGRGAV